MKKTTRWVWVLAAVVSLAPGATLVAQTPVRVDVQVEISHVLHDPHPRAGMPYLELHTAFHQGADCILIPSFEGGFALGLRKDFSNDRKAATENRGEGEEVGFDVSRADGVRHWVYDERGKVRLSGEILLSGAVLPPLWQRQNPFHITTCRQDPSRGTFWYWLGRVEVGDPGGPIVKGKNLLNPTTRGPYLYNSNKESDARWEKICAQSFNPNSKSLGHLVDSFSWADLASGKRIELVADYDFAATGNEGWKAHLHIAATLSQSEVELVADPGGPYSPLRGTTVTLDGSRSRPSKGRQIRSYKWKLTPTGCPDLGTPTELTGPRVTFKVLCAVRAELTVDDGAKTATNGVEVTVTARPWKTKLTTDPALDLKNFGFEPGNFALGMNRCQKHPDPNENHYYHPRPGSMVDYEEGTFWLERVADNGPFRGIWFVAKGEFGMPRVLMINQKLYPGGSVYKVNAAKGPKQKKMIDRLRHSVELHESLHSTLLERAVNATADPAKAVEGGMAKDREALKKQMNFILRDAFTRLNQATAEDKVKAEMRKIKEFRAGGRIYYPASGEVRAGYRDFPSFAELGDK